MADEKGTPDVQRFSHQEYDTSCCLEILCCGGSTLVLGEEDAEFTKTCWLGLCTNQKRGPYGELGTVDSEQRLCFHSFKAASLMPSQDSSGQCIGCGCNQGAVQDIVHELKKRQALRGDRAKTRMAESTVASLALLHQKIDTVMAHLNLPPPPVITDAEQMER